MPEFDDSNVPIVGQPAQVVFWYPTVIVLCKCRGEGQQSLIVLSGFGNISECGICHKHYQAIAIDVKGVPGLKVTNENGSMAVGVMIPQTGSGTVQ